MKPSEKTTKLLNEILGRIKKLDTVYNLPKTHIEVKDSDVDGIRAHAGVDGNTYYRLTNNGWDVTVGMDYERFIKLVPQMLTPQELASLTASDTPEKEKHITTVAFYTDYNAYNAESGNIVGSMSYTFGGDYEESRRDVEPDESENEILKEYTDDLRAACQEEYDEENEKEGYIPLYTIEKHVFDAVMDEDGDIIEEELKERTEIFTIALCSKETAEKYDLEADEFIA